jgi:hypothetical protein
VRKGVAKKTQGVATETKKEPHSEKVDGFYIDDLAPDNDGSGGDVIVEQKRIQIGIVDPQVTALGNIQNKSRGKALQASDVSVVGRNDHVSIRGIKNRKAAAHFA